MEDKIKKLEEDLCYLMKEIKDLKSQQREFHYHVHITYNTKPQMPIQGFFPLDDNPFDNLYGFPTD